MSEYVKTLILNDLRRMCIKQIEKGIYVVEIKTRWVSRHYIQAGIPDSVVKVSWREVYRELGKCVKKRKKGVIVVFCGCLV